MLRNARLALLIRLISVVVLIAFSTESLNSGIRGRGKYSGVVLFDRWDDCFLLSGPYVTYISDRVKNDLRSYASKAVQIDALDVVQPVNPGDGLVKEYTIVGPAPDTRRWDVVDGLELSVESDFAQRHPAFLIGVSNVGNDAVEIHSSNFGPTLFGVVPEARVFTPSDGKSMALITRADLLGPASKSGSLDDKKFSAAYKVESRSRPPRVFQLAPGETRKVRVIFKVPPGQYQFITGYGGGVHEEKSIVSNAISFDIAPDGTPSKIY